MVFGCLYEEHMESTAKEEVANLSFSGICIHQYIHIEMEDLSRDSLPLFFLKKA